MILALVALQALAQDPGAPLESRYAEAKPNPPLPGGLTFFGQVQIRGQASNLDSTNPLLDGQVLGVMGGTNGVTPSSEVVALSSEQRVGGNFTYRPKVLDGKAGLTAAFEIDFGFGDRSYGVGGNTGGAFGADQVNLQTRRLTADFYPSTAKHAAHVVAGLQFVGDSVNDPTATTPDGLMRSGGRLAFFGSEAAGLAVYGRLHDAGGDHLRYRLGAFTLYEQGTSRPDDLSLVVGDVQWHPAYATTVGIHAWYLQDRTAGTAGSIGEGPGSALAEMLGGPNIDLYDGQTPPDNAEVFSDLGWFGADAGYNAGLTQGDFGITGSAFANVGRFYAPIVHDDSVLGFMIDGEARYRYAPGEGSVLRLETLVATGDGPNPDRYSGIITGNSYGYAGAVYATHGCLLLFPDVRSINRMVSVVPDISGAGRGVTGITASVGFDPVPDRINATVGFGQAFTANGISWGTELNAKVSAEPLPFLDVGVYVAGVVPGPAAELNASPWTVYAAADWLVF